MCVTSRLEELAHPSWLHLVAYPKEGNHMQAPPPSQAAHCSSYVPHSGLLPTLMMEVCCITHKVEACQVNAYDIKPNEERGHLLLGHIGKLEPLNRKSNYHSKLASSMCLRFGKLGKPSIHLK